ncbi:lysine-specific demethylase 2B-like [Hypanus sabinus]|uniref:lysine-specific demethylase 2B-like n=1 Tax=Hypanus sabinus TaxID=79690 RepID=UPI0028C4363B|nr:lysine-specific demethylase 2B-like [Hypanus sabinus]
MDVNTQKGIEMTMAQWVKYYETPAEEREKLYNVISLEFSHTKLENIVQRPATVDLVDWVDNIWPRHLKERQTDSTNAIIEMKYPKVRKYCLMSVRGCYTDFHIDFGGTSVWYHIHRGGKIFWLIPPTPLNLEIYESWVLSGKQGDIFLGDKVEKCQRIELKQGYTFLIPSGWIHAVYTPEDTLVFGGNFLHSFNIPTQLRIYNIEDRTRVPLKFRYPFYYEMCWYVVERYVFFLAKCSHLTKQFQKESQLIDSDSESDSDSSSSEEDGEGEGIAGGPPAAPRTRGVWPPRLPPLCPRPLPPGQTNGLGAEGGAPRALKRSPSSESQDSRADGWIHLTHFERSGLRALVDRLESLPENKRCVPDGLIDAESLLKDMKKVLEDHMNDDPKLACTGFPIIRWPKKRDKPKMGRPRSRPPPLPPGRPPVVRGGPGSRRRRRRCKQCAACRRRECGLCHYCRDMKKFGGPGRMKQSCVLRQCEAPILPHTALCMICDEGGQDAEGMSGARGALMECSTCSEIVHPSCLKLDSSLGVISQQLPNCWSVQSAYSWNRGRRRCVFQERRTLPLKAPQPEGGHPSQAERPRLAVGAVRRKLEGLPPPRHSDYLLMRKRRLAVAEQSARNKIKLEREQILLRTKRKAEDDVDHPSLLKFPRPGKGAAIFRAERLRRCHLRRTQSLALHPSSSFSPGLPLRPPLPSSDGNPTHPRLSDGVKAEVGGLQPPVRLQRPPADFRGSGAPRRPLSASRPPGRGTGGAEGGGCPCGRAGPPMPSPGGSPSEDQMMQRHVWLLVFRYLTQRELCVCMRVCKAWNKWCCDKRLWTRINLSRCKSITPLALSGISRRLPVSLDLSWSNISRKQLTWLISRLPGLKDLFLSGCTWSAISALSSHSCPLLRTLDLRWADGLRDPQMRELFCAPDKPGQLDNRSKLRNVTDFRLAGLDISDVTLRLIIRHMPVLARLDLSHCSHLSDHSLNLLTAVGSSTRNSLSELHLEGKGVRPVAVSLCPLPPPSL